MTFILSLSLSLSLSLLLLLLRALLFLRHFRGRLFNADTVHI